MDAKAAICSFGGTEAVFSLQAWRGSLLGSVLDHREGLRCESIDHFVSVGHSAITKSGDHLLALSRENNACDLVE